MILLLISRWSLIIYSWHSWRWTSIQWNRLERLHLLLLFRIVLSIAIFGFDQLLLAVRISW